jgi:hypothetical protein
MTKNTVVPIKDQAPKRFADITVMYKDGTKDFFEDIIGYQVGGGALGISLQEGITHVINFDLVTSLIHILKEVE